MLRGFHAAGRRSSHATPGPSGAATAGPLRMEGGPDPGVSALQYASEGSHSFVLLVAERVAARAVTVQ